MSAEVKPGYKPTEVGVIPEDWEVRQLSEHFNIYAGGDVPKHSLSQNQSELHPYPIFANALKSEGLYGYTNEYRSKANSLTITARGFLGHAEYRDQPFFPIVRLLVLEPTGELDARFTTYMVNSQIKFPIESTGVPQLTAPQVGKYLVGSPPTIFEQRAITHALSGIDTLISSLEQLVAKKRDIQQAAMQQLLSGQRRLPGFSGAWEVKRFGEVVVCRSERVDPRSAGRQDFCVELEHIEPRSGRLIGQTVAEESSSLKTAFKRRDVLFGKLRAYQRKYWFAEHSGVCSTEIWALSCDTSRLLPEFLYHCVKTDAFIEVASTAYGTHMPRSDWKVMKHFEISLPTCEEQTAIATILSDMDAELAALEARRNKALQLKQGMMQELLTGRIRLVR